MKVYNVNVKNLIVIIITKMNIHNFLTIYNIIWYKYICMEYARNG